MVRRFSLCLGSVKSEFQARSRHVGTLPGAAESPVGTALLGLPRQDALDSCVSPVPASFGQDALRFQARGDAPVGRAVRVKLAHAGDGFLLAGVFDETPFGAKVPAVGRVPADALQPMNEVTRILSAIEQGDPHAAEQLLPLVYDELRRPAAQKLAQEKPGQILEATGLVHEAYIRLVQSP